MLLFLDGQAHYDTPRIALKYSAVDASNATWSVTAEGRFGNCLKRVATNNAPSPLGHLGIAPLMTRLGLWTPTASGVCGFAVRVDDLSRVGSNSIAGNGAGILVVREGADWHVALQLNLDGTFTLYRNNTVGGILLAQSVEGIGSASWAFLECKWLIDPTAGFFTLRANGLPVLSFTGPTKAAVLSTLGVWNAVHVLGVQSQATANPALLPWLTLRMSDLYLADLTAPLAADVSDFLGDGVVQTILPNGVGASSGWTPTGAAPNWAAVDDRPAPDDDATYVGTSAAGTQDTYQCEDISPDAVVKAVQVNILARKETEGSAAVAPIVRQGTTDYVGPTQGVASVAYDRYLTQPYDLNPATVAKFTAAEINAGQFGVQKVI